MPSIASPSLTADPTHRAVTQISDLIRQTWRNHGGRSQKPTHLQVTPGELFAMLDESKNSLLREFYVEETNAGHLSVAAWSNFEGVLFVAVVDCARREAFAAREADRIAVSDLITYAAFLVASADKSQLGHLIAWLSPPSSHQQIAA